MPSSVLSEDEVEKRTRRKSEKAATFAFFQQSCARGKSLPVRHLRGCPKDHRNPADLDETRTKS